MMAGQTNEPEQRSAMAERSPTGPKDVAGLAPPPAPSVSPPTSPSVTTALKHAPMGIAIFDDQMRYLAASRQYLTDQNMPADTPLLGRGHYEVFPEIPQTWRDKHAQVLAEGVELRNDEGDRYVDRNGDVHWVRWSMAPWRTDDGRDRRAGALYRDGHPGGRGPPSAAGRRGPLPRGVRPGGDGRGPGRRPRAVPGGQRPLLRHHPPRPRDPAGLDVHGHRARRGRPAHRGHQGQALLAGEIETYAVERRIDGLEGPVWVHVNASRVDPGDGAPYLVVIISNITARKQAEAEQQHYQGQLRLLINELNHRVKNTLATVQSMASQTLKTEADPVTAFEKFESRLLGLSQVHDVLTRESWHGAGLRDVAERALAPFTPSAKDDGDGADRLTIDGPPVWLAPGGALTMALIFHELATNALKYGALSNGEGRVVLAWTYDAQTRDLALTWTETGGPPVAKPTRRGFGSRLIERSLRGELKGAATMDYGPRGLVCTMRATLSDPVEGAGPLGA
jgi:two-component sensor histidine kinase